MPGEKNLALTTYEIKIRGHLNHEWAKWFYDLTLTHESDGTTTLYGPLPDQTVLHSVLDRIRDMNLRLISVTEVEASPNASSSCGDLQEEGQPGQRQAACDRRLAANGEKK